RATGADLRRPHPGHGRGGRVPDLPRSRQPLGGRLGAERRRTGGRRGGGSMSTPAGFDELIHPATRLSVVALLAATEWADFAFVRDSLSLSDSALSKQLHTLEGAG